MTDATSTPSTEAAAPELDLRTVTLLAAMAQVDEEAARTRKATVRDETLRHLVAEHERTGSKSFLIEAPDGRKIGQATFKESPDSTQVVDQDKLAEWVGEHFPDEVEFVVRVRGAFEKRLLEREVAWIEDPEWAPDPESDTPVDQQKAPLVPVYTGDKAEAAGLVPGLMLRRGKVDTSTFTLTFAKPKAGAAVTVENQADGRQIVTELLEQQAAGTLQIGVGKPVIES